MSTYQTTNAEGSSTNTTASNTATDSAGDTVERYYLDEAEPSLSEQPALDAASSPLAEDSRYPADVADDNAADLLKVLAAILPAGACPCPRGGYDVRMLLGGEILTWHLAADPGGLVVTDPITARACAAPTIGTATADALGRLVAELAAEREAEAHAPIASAGLYRVRSTADGGYLLSVIGAQKETLRQAVPGALLRSAAVLPGVRRMLTLFAGR
jgi:hypothetical protein